MWWTRQPHEGKLGSTHPAGPGFPHCPVGQSRRGGKPTKPEVQGSRPHLARGHLRPVITFPEPEDSAGVRTDVQTRRLCDFPVVPCSRLMCTHMPTHTHTCLHIHTHAYTYIHRPVRTHTHHSPGVVLRMTGCHQSSWGLCGNSWWGRGQGVGEGTPGMTGTCPSCSSHLPEEEVPACPSPPFPTCPKIPHTPPWLPHTPTMPWFPPFLGPIAHLVWAHFF